MNRVKSLSINIGKIWRIARPLLGYIIAVVCLIWVFHDINPRRILAELNNISWGWIVLGVIADISSYVSQGLRWRILLKPVSDIRLSKTTQAIYCGIFTNEVLPFRTGELVRAYLVSRWNNVGFVAVIPSILVERFFDAIWIGIGVGFTALLADLPKNLVRAADTLGVVILTFVAIFIYLTLRKERKLLEGQDTIQNRGRLLGALGRIFTRLANGIKTIGLSRNFFLALFVSPLILIFQILSFWCIMQGYGLHLSLWAGAAVMIIVLLGTAIPNAPSNIGTYQFFTVVGLTLFGISKTTASGFSLAVFVILTVPLWLLGFIAISHSGMRLKEIRGEISNLAKRTKGAGDKI
jgi:glycosyltransferase 2 family protein